MAAGASPVSMLQQTVPSGMQSMNMNPLGSGLMNQSNISPITATLPGAGSSSSGGSYPGINLTIPGGVTGGSSSSVNIPGLAAATPTGNVGNVPTGTTPGTTTGNTLGTTTPAGTGAAGGYNPGAGVTNPNATTQEAGSKTMLGDFQATYGQGTGTALANTLGSLGTTTSTAEQLMLKPTEMAAQASLANAQAQEAASGVSADSSTAALMAAGLGGQVSAAVAGETGQIGLQEEQTLLQALQSEGTAHGSDVSGWDQFGSVMQGIGQAGLQLGTAAMLGPGASTLLSKL